MRKRLGLLLPVLCCIGAAATPAHAQPVVPPTAFAPCAGCHSTQAGKTLFGPSLAGVAGRKAGGLPGYAYSPAMRSTKFNWTAAMLDRWLKEPKKLVPGTRMPFAGITDAKARKSVVDFVMTLR